MSKNINVPKLRFKEFSGNWEEKVLDNIATFSKGKGISKADIDENGAIECIRYGQLYTIYNELIKDIVSKTNVNENDLVLSSYGDIIIPASGETQIDIATASCILKDNVALGGDLNIIRAEEDGVFLSYYLNNAKKFDIARLSQGISVVHLYSSQLKTLKLNLPQKQEQEKIASFLTSVDTKIKQLTKKESLLKEYKKGVMQKLFNKEIRFKADEGSDFCEWENKKLEELTKINQGLQIAISERYFERVPNSYFYITNEFLKENSDKKYFIKNPSQSVVCNENDILMTRTGNTGQVVTNVNGAFHNNFFKINYFENFNKDFLVYYFRLESTQNMIMRYAGTSTIPDLNHGDFYRLKIQLPSIEEQTKIANFLSSIDIKIEQNQKKLKQTKEFKKALLQQMFI